MNFWHNTFMVGWKMAGWMTMRWTTRTASLAILGCVLCGMLLIVALPDFDLPNTALHRGTTPAVARAHSLPGSSAATVAMHSQLLRTADVPRLLYGQGLPAASSAPDPLPVLLQCLRC